MEMEVQADKRGKARVLKFRGGRGQRQRAGRALWLRAYEMLGGRLLIVLLSRGAAAGRLGDGEPHGTAAVPGAVRCRCLPRRPRLRLSPQGSAMRLVELPAALCLRSARRACACAAAAAPLAVLALLRLHAASTLVPSLRSNSRLKRA